MSRVKAFALIIVLASSPSLVGQDLQFSLSGQAVPPKQAQEIAELESRLTSENPADFESASIALAKIASELSNSAHSSEALRIARNVFLSSAPARARRAAFNILERLDPNELAKHVTVVRMKGPHCTCWGRFQDALDQRLLGDNAWVLKARASNTFVKENPKELGTLASLEFAIGNQHKQTDLIVALKEAGFDVKGWKLLVEVPVESYLDASSDDPIQ